VQTLRGPDGTDKVTVIDAVVGTSASEVSEGVSTASSLASQIRLFNDTLPLIGGIVGIVLLVVGIILVAIRPRRA
jgi:multidrug transporter EmrE-like cation transporter